jgi:hypothetical protein
MLCMQVPSRLAPVACVACPASTLLQAALDTAVVLPPPPLLLLLLLFQVIDKSLEAQVLRSDNSSLARDCWRDMQQLNR